MRLRWVVFDTNGTVLDPRPISANLPAPLNDRAAALSLLHETIFQTMADTLAGQYRPFTDYLAAVVRRQLELNGHEPDRWVPEAVAAAGRLPAFPDAGPALDVLAGAGLRIATFTNSPTESAERALSAAGLRDRFDAVVGSDTCQAYKPARKVYQNGLRLIGADPADTCMVAAHGWDLLGAAQAGMHTAWVCGDERRPLAIHPAFDVTAANLSGIAQEVLAQLAD